MHSRTQIRVTVGDCCAFALGSSTRRPTSATIIPPPLRRLPALVRVSSAAPDPPHATPSSTRIQH